MFYSIHNIHSIYFYLMELLLKNAAQINNSCLTMSQRGILITILLIRDSDPKVTLAIFKAKFKVSELKEDLIFLHENNFIKWTEYNKYKKIEEKSIVSPDVIEAVSFMNSLYGRNFDVNSQSTTKNLTARIKQYGLEKVKKVIANRWEEWKDNERMKKHLRPSTIFRSSKFDKYLEEVLTSGRGLKYITADQINLLDGDEFTFENVSKLNNDDVYSIKKYILDQSGSELGGGVKEKHYGKDLKILISIQDKKIKNGKKREFKYKYIKD